VTVHGYAVTSGWTDPALVPLEKKLSADGILDLDFVGTPPDSINMPVLSPQTAELVWSDDVDRLVGVRVVSRTGDVVRLIDRQAAQATTPASETTQIAGEGQHPHFAAAAMAGGGATTMATGEEGPPPISTMATGEETMMTTLMLGEEGGGLPPTTHLLGEEHHGYPPTTLMLGEEGGGLPPTTHMLGEEGGGLPPTTHMLGEEGGGLPPTTHMLGEEGGGLPPTTQMLGEEGGGLPPGSEAAKASPDAALATTAPLMEETTQIAGEGQPPHITTMLQAEEQGGGGTMFTTLIVGEEGGTTAPWFEEMMPGPVITARRNQPHDRRPQGSGGRGMVRSAEFQSAGPPLTACGG
jgi:hypothetical protein